MVTDQRVARTCSVFEKKGYSILLVGRKQKKSKTLEQRSYQCLRLKLFFEQGVAFYLFFNVRLFFVLLFRKADVLLANDLDTLLPNYLVSKLKGVPLIYDSHEVFCEVPELQNNPTKKKIWESLEKWIVPKLKYCVTVNNSIAQYFEKKYHIPFIAVRNIPNYTDNQLPKSKGQLGLPENKKIIILQGAGINVQRGAEELVESFKYIKDEFVLLIVGSGDVIHQLKENTKQWNLNHKIIFIDKVPAKELRNYTINADLGVSIDKDTNLNYHFSLPNKLFDYLHAGIPVLASRLPEIEKIISTYEVGVFIENHEPKHIAKIIEDFLSNEIYLLYKNNTKKASQENKWETEEKNWLLLIEKIEQRHF